MTGEIKRKPRVRNPRSQEKKTWQGENDNLQFSF